MSRSPKYPTKSLETALNMAEKAYNNLGTTSVSTETFYQALGYGGRNGASQGALAAIKYYGLVEVSGDEVQISDLFQKIYRPLNDQEKYDGLKQASKEPKLFGELLSEYDVIPPANLLASIAIRKFGFSETGAKRFAKSLIATNAFVESNKPDQTPSDTLGKEPNPLPLDDNSNTALKSVNSALLSAEPNNADISENTLKFQLSQSTTAEVKFNGEIDHTMIERLIKHLQLTKEIYE